ncbi:hypothetical protein BJF83_18295 [Nocardiopsis sp. CNR-923]|uniref:hypothetical protein n=1 Tax=Nocardiopsis sp. CNR-923 TaxID=1904965 RepID=UPI000960C4B2|nr:hypothetical protein [Nocardiopsis sp. CNR-923]OLT27540.1 hypothetical protein BJF83_18295 [Nocardiopsis sp. CNR-923]
MVVAGAAFGVADVLLQGVADGGAVGEPVRQTGADEGVGVEQVEFAAQGAVVVHGAVSSRWGASDRVREAPGHSPRGLVRQ